MQDYRFPETIRISRSSYEDIKERVRKTLKKAKKDEDDGCMAFAAERYPTLKELKEHDVKMNLRKYFPYLILYREVYETDEEAFYEARQYIDDLFDDYVEIIDDDDIRPICEMTPEKWKTLTLEEKCEVFDRLLQYYGYNEFETFFLDLGYQPYMAYRKVTPKKYRKKDGIKTIEKELRKIWDAWFGISMIGQSLEH